MLSARTSRRRALLALLFVAAAASACRAPRAQPKPRTLVVASDLDNAPFARVDVLGRPAGRDVEMMERLAAVIGYELTWRRMPFEELVEACARGEVDVVCATLGRTPERAARVHYTRPYFTTRLAVLVRTGAGQPRSLAELAGRPVAAGAGTTSERAVRERLPASRGVFAPKSADLLAAGGVDAVVLDGPDADRRAAASRGRLAVLPQALAAESYHLIVRPDRPELARDLDLALRALRVTGSLERLDAKYGLAANAP